MIKIGIDAGVNTGLAEIFDGKLVEVKSMSIIEAMRSVEHKINYANANEIHIKIYIEDARLRTWVTGGREKLQGVGSVKRDSAIWEEFCVFHDVDFELVAPKNNKTKISRDLFKKITGWTGRTSEHARDAAMLIWGRK